MVIINKNSARNISLDRYNENLKGFTKAKDIITEEEFTDLKNIWMEGFSVRIIELQK